MEGSSTKLQELQKQLAAGLSPDELAHRLSSAFQKFDLRRVPLLAHFQDDVLKDLLAEVQAVESLNLSEKRLKKEEEDLTQVCMQRETREGEGLSQ